MLLIIPLASPIILYFAFDQSRKGNRMQVSSHFYEQECIVVDRFIEEGRISRNAFLKRKTNSYDIGGLDNVSYGKSFENFILLSLSLERIKEIIEGDKNSKEYIKLSEDIGQFYQYYSQYIKYYRSIAFWVKSINQKVRNKYIIDAHKTLLFIQLFPHITDFLTCSYSLLDKDFLYNPVVSYVDPLSRAELKGDLFKKDMLRDLSNIIGELGDVAAKNSSHLQIRA